MSEFNLETSHSAGFWDERYTGSERIWSGRANQRLIEEIDHLPVGAALDIGCGEGGDAVWLAERGWTVLAVDVSAVAVDKARAYASATLPADVARRITWRQADILSWQPPAAAFDLVSMQFLHLPRPALADAQARLAVAVRSGGSLLIVNHDPRDLPTGPGHAHVPELFLTTDEVVATLDPGGWRAEVARTLPRPFTDPDGNERTIHDVIVRAVRR
jgi:SAM-dependent methyltransferase